VDAPAFDHCLSFLNAVEDFTVQAFVPELLRRSGFLAGRSNAFALSLQDLDLPELRNDLLGS